MEPSKPVQGVGAVVVGLVIGIAAGVALTYFGTVLGLGSVELSIVAIFAVSLLIGVAGALVFLIVQMLTEEEVNVLKRIMKSRYGIPPSAMSALFVLSGGLVAGFSQASVGSFTSGNIWTTFLVGFGWQGVIAGVGGAAAVRDKEAEGDRGMEAVTRESVGTVRSIVDPLLQMLAGITICLNTSRRRLTACGGSPGRRATSYDRINRNQNRNRGDSPRVT